MYCYSLKIWTFSKFTITRQLETQNTNFTITRTKIKLFNENNTTVYICVKFCFLQCSFITMLVATSLLYLYTHLSVQTLVLHSV